MVSATAFDSDARRALRLSSGSAVVVSSFSSGILNNYSRKTVRSSQVEKWRDTAPATGLNYSGSEVKLIPIQVECYAGGAKADETPLRFHWSERTIEVLELLDRWYQVESKPEWPRAAYFRARAADSREFLLKHDLESTSGFWASSGNVL